MPWQRRDVEQKGGRAGAKPQMIRQVLVRLKNEVGRILPLFRARKARGFREDVDNGPDAGFEPAHPCAAAAALLSRWVPAADSPANMGS